MQIQSCRLQHLRDFPNEFRAKGDEGSHNHAVTGETAARINFSEINFQPLSHIKFIESVLTAAQISGTLHQMPKYSTRQAAQKLGIGMTSLSRYIADGKIPAPEATIIGRYEVRAWSEEEIERVRLLLPKIANGRRKHSAVSTQQSGKERARKKKTQPRAAVPHEQSKTKAAPKRSKP